MKTGKISSLTGIRALLALQVLSFHYRATKGQSPFNDVSFIWTWGVYAVGLFFIMSGFLTGYVYKKIICKLSFKEYLWRRVRGIIIPLFLINTFSTILWAVEWYVLKMYEIEIYYIKPFSLIRILSSYLNLSRGWLINFMPMDGPLWYMSVLMLCELIYWIISRVSSNDTTRRAIFIAFCVIGLTIYLLDVEYIPFLFGTSNGRAYMGFFAGLLAYEAYEKNAFKSVVGVLLVAVGVIIPELGFPYGEVIRYFTLDIGVLILLVKNEFVSKLASNRVFVWLGGLSTAVYMVHEPLQDFVLALDYRFDWNIDTANVWVYVVSTILTYIMAIGFDILCKIVKENSRLWKKLNDEIVRY